jgi:hypothetical protein
VWPTYGPLVAHSEIGCSGLSAKLSISRKRLAGHILNSG